MQSYVSRLPLVRLGGGVGGGGLKPIRLLQYPLLNFLVFPKAIAGTRGVVSLSRLEEFLSLERGEYGWGGDRRS